ncbi:MAG TPA: cytochrome d ubiquinol oxidase subunit II [Galbitalea sp.]
MDFLPTLWFVLVAVLWIGYLLLEGFDLGVGMHMLFSARNDVQRRVMLNTIGPVWDGNEVWLVTAGAAIFAAFPYWYAALISTLYIPVTLVLVGLIFRAAGIEYRGKGASARWARFWDYGIAIGSLVVAFGIGALLMLTTTGLPLDANGDRVGGPFVWLTVPAVLGGLAVVGFCLVHSATFLGLKSDGTVRVAMRRFVTRWSPLLLLPLTAWVLLIQVEHGKPLTWALVPITVAAAVFGWLGARSGHEGRAFIGFAAFLALGAASIFGAVYPVVLPSTISHSFDLTIENASSAPYTLAVMSVVAAFGLPVVIAYQSWSYWVFRKRIAETHIPEAHIVRPAIRDAVPGTKR